MRIPTRIPNPESRIPSCVGAAPLSLPRPGARGGCRRPARARDDRSPRLRGRHGHALRGSVADVRTLVGGGVGCTPTQHPPPPPTRPIPPPPPLPGPPPRKNLGGTPKNMGSERGLPRAHPPNRLVGPAPTRTQTFS